MWSRDWRVSETCLKSVSEVCRRCAAHLDRHVEDGASRHSVRRLAAGGLRQNSRGHLTGQGLDTMKSVKL